MVADPLLSPPAAAVRTGSSRRGRISPQRATLAALLAVYMAGVLPQPADAAFECRIKKSITSGYSFDISDDFQAWGESYPAHIYATVASTGCTADATALSSRVATAAALRCSTQTNLPASTNSGYSSANYRRYSETVTAAITPSVAMSFATLGANLVDEDFWCYGNSGSTSYGAIYWSGGTTCGSAPPGVPALLAPANTSCGVTAARLNEVIGNGVDFYCDGYIGFLQLRDCPDKIGILNDFVAGASTTTPTAAPTAAPSAGPTHCDMVRDGGEHVDNNSREFCETAFATGLCDSAAVVASCNFTCTGCTAAPTVSPTVAAAPAAAPTSSVEGLVAAVAALVSQVATLNSSLTATQADLTATRTDLAQVRACNDAGQLYSSSTDTCEDPPPPPSGSTTECVRPACGEGTQAEDGECIPDCDDLRRRSLDCHPFCDGPDDNLDVSLEIAIPTTPTWPQSSGSNSGESGGGGLAIVIGAVSGTILLVLLTVIACQRANRQATVPLPPKRIAVANPAYGGALYDVANYAEVGNGNGNAAPGTAQAPLYDEVGFIRDQYAELSADHSTYNSDA